MLDSSALALLLVVAVLGHGCDSVGESMNTSRPETFSL